MTISAYHNDARYRRLLLAYLAVDREAGRLKGSGIRWQDRDGALGIAIVRVLELTGRILGGQLETIDWRARSQGSDLASYSAYQMLEREGGIAAPLAVAMDFFGEELESDAWPSQFLEAIPVGADLEAAWARYVGALLVEKLRPCATSDVTAMAVKGVAEFFTSPGARPSRDARPEDTVRSAENAARAAWETANQSRPASKEFFRAGAAAEAAAAAASFMLLQLRPNLVGYAAEGLRHTIKAIACAEAAATDSGSASRHTVEATTALGEQLLDVLEEAVPSAASTGTARAAAGARR